VSDAHQLLRHAYDAFNQRDVDAAVSLLHPRVNWPNAWEGGRLLGRAAVRDYWERQFAQISSTVELQRFIDEQDGSVTVEVRQVVRDAHTHELISDSSVRHRFRFDEGLITRMDVIDDEE
jgi:ketosteroid isomerase-like protein